VIEKDSLNLTLILFLVTLSDELTERNEIRRWSFSNF